MRTIEVGPELYKRMDELAENYTASATAYKSALKNMISKRAVTHERVGFHCQRRMQLFYYDAAEREAERCAKLHGDRCKWLYV